MAARNGHVEKVTTVRNRVMTASDTHKEWHAWSKMGGAQEEECSVRNCSQALGRITGGLVSIFINSFSNRISTPSLEPQRNARLIKETFKEQVDKWIACW